MVVFMCIFKYMKCLTFAMLYCYFDRQFEAISSDECDIVRDLQSCNAALRPPTKRLLVLESFGSLTVVVVL